MDQRKIDKIVVHCSDSPDTMNIGLDEIDQWHQERGFTGIAVGKRRIYCGYHYVVRRDGSIEVGRPEWAIGAHAKGFNSTSIGIVWVGRKEIETVQYAALVGMIKMICNKYGLKPKHVFGHHQLNPDKTCPNLDMSKLRDELSFVMGLA